MDIPKDRFYTKTHEWALPEGDTVLVGITDYAQDALGDVVYVELPEVGRVVEKGEADVQVLHSTDKWYGMTYAADRQMVIDAIARMIREGVYPERL